MSKLSMNDIFATWGYDPEPEHLNWSSNLDLEYTSLSNLEFESAILQVLKVLERELSKAGPHRKTDWENGWGENLRKFSESGEYHATLPGYFEKSRIIRWKQKWIKPNDTYLEQKLLAVLVDSLVVKFGNLASPIYEFGCGTGHHLFRLRNLFPNKKLVGLDWASSSQELISNYADSKNDPQLFGQNFDFFAPNYELQIDKDSMFFTVASLEQTHDNYVKFVDFVFHANPKIVINIEPMGEFLDSENLLDNLSLKYFAKRNYLTGYFDYLKSLEKKGKIIIHDARRSFLGSFFVDGYSIVVWSPLVND